MLRGNHECSAISRMYGFHDECRKRYSLAVWRQINRAFRGLPLAAIVEENIFCTHGGLSPEMESLDDILKIPRPTDLSIDGLLCDLLWADPCVDVENWRVSDRGVS